MWTPFHPGTAECNAREVNISKRMLNRASSKTVEHAFAGPLGTAAEILVSRRRNSSARDKANTTH